MFSARRMLFTHPRQSILWEFPGQLDERRPQTPMHIRDFSVDQFADQNVGTVADGLSDAEYFTTFGMPPPTSANWLARNLCRETRHWAACGLKHNARAPNDCKRLTSGHCSSSRKQC